MEFLQWCWVFCYNHNRPLFLTCLTWTKFHPMGILLGFTKGKLFVDEFISPGRNWGPLVKRFGKPGWKERGKVLTNRNCEMFLHPIPFQTSQKNTGSCCFLTTTRLKTTFPPTFKIKKGPSWVNIAALSVFGIWDLAARTQKTIELFGVHCVLFRAEYETDRQSWDVVRPEFSGFFWYRGIHGARKGIDARDCCSIFLLYCD